MADSQQGKARRPERRLIHDVIHQHIQRVGSNDYHLCWSAREIPSAGDGYQVVSWIRTGAYLDEWTGRGGGQQSARQPQELITDVHDPLLRDPSSWDRVGRSLVIFGSDDPRIRARVNRLRRQVEGGRCLVHNLSLTLTPEHMLLFQLHRALRPSPRLAFPPGTVPTTGSLPPWPWPSGWDSYLKAHRARSAATLRAGLRHLLQDLIAECPAIPEFCRCRVKPRHRPGGNDDCSVLAVLTRKVRTRAAGVRPAHQSLRTLSTALCASFLGISQARLARSLQGSKGGTTFGGTF